MTPDLTLFYQAYKRAGNRVLFRDLLLQSWVGADRDYLFIGQFGSSAPFTARKSFQALRTLVAVLLRSRCPTAILRKIAKVVVGAVNRHFTDRALPHVGVKVFEYEPSLADIDPTPAPVSIVTVGSVSTSLDHIDPAFVSASLHVLRSVPAGEPQTNAAGSRMPGPKVSATDRDLLTAVALAEPNVVSVGSAALPFDHNEPSKTLRCDINDFGHRNRSNDFMSSGGLILTDQPVAQYNRGG
jgi:hypothetical protein